MAESMKELLRTELEVINEKVEAFTIPPTMERRVVIVGFFSLTVSVKMEKFRSSVGKMDNSQVEELISEKPQTR